MYRFNCVVFESNNNSLKILSQLILNQNFLILNQSFFNIYETIEYVNNNNIEIIFIDIDNDEIKKDFSKILTLFKNNPTIIIISENKNLAFIAIQNNVFDYIEKPLTTVKLNFTFLKIYQHLLNNHYQFIKNEIYIKNKTKYINIKIESINYIENQTEKIIIHTDEENHLISSSFNIIEKKLSRYNFFKVHRSYIVNLSKIDFIYGNEISICSNLIPISRSIKSELFNRLNVL